MFNDTASLLRLYRGYTLVDITETGVTRSTPANTKLRNQQRNWETLIQVISLRTQLSVLSTPERNSLDITDKFDLRYAGKHNVWMFKFGIEQEGIFASDSDKFGTLASDFMNVPVVTGLDETVSLAVPVFDAISIKNLWFEEIDL